jgi:hypothetical protein
MSGSNRRRGHFHLNLVKNQIPQLHPPPFISFPPPLFTITSMFNSFLSQAPIHFSFHFIPRSRPVDLLTPQIYLIPSKSVQPQSPKSTSTGPPTTYNNTICLFFATFSTSPTINELPNLRPCHVLSETAYILIAGQLLAKSVCSVSQKVGGLAPRDTIV